MENIYDISGYVKYVRTEYFVIINNAELFIGMLVQYEADVLAIDKLYNVFAHMLITIPKTPGTCTDR